MKQCTLIDITFGALRKYINNLSSCPRQIPLVPLCLEYPDGEEGVEEEAPGPSSGTSSTATTGSKKKSNLKSGQHGRHQISKKKVHAIHKIGPKQEPLEPTTIMGTFSNQCSCIVREKVPITYENWKSVPKDLKGVVWGEMTRQFT